VGRAWEAAFFDLHFAKPLHHEELTGIYSYPSLRLSEDNLQVRFDLRVGGDWYRETDGFT
jgi:hypothetical protein